MMDKSAHAESREPEAAATETRAAADVVIYLPDDRQRTKKAASGSNRRKRHHLEQFRTDDAEHEALHEQLRTLSLSLGAFVMQLGKIAGGKVSRPRRRREIKMVDDIEVLLSQMVVALNRIGNNQNQEVRALNELARFAHEHNHARLENMLAGRIEELRRLPDLLAEPIAALMAVLNNEREG